MGDDQKAHIELARDIAQRVNHMYGGRSWKKLGGRGGRLLTVPDVFMPPQGARVMSLTVCPPAQQLAPMWSGVGVVAARIYPVLVSSADSGGLAMRQPCGLAGAVCLGCIPAAGCDHLGDCTGLP